MAETLSMMLPLGTPRPGFALMNTVTGKTVADRDLAGTNGTLLHTTDGGAHWFVEPSNVSHALERLFVIDRSHGWAVGFGGTILTYGSNSSAPKLKS